MNAFVVSGLIKRRVHSITALSQELLCAEWAAQWCTERPLLARRLLAKPLPHIPEVSRRVTAAESGADAKLDVAAL